MATALSAPVLPQADEAPIVARRRPGRVVASVLALLVLAMVFNSVLRNRAFEWDVVAQYFTTTAIVQGLLLTLWLTAAVMVLGFALGTAFAVCRLSDNPVLRSISWGFVWIFRSTPLLVQLVFWDFLGALWP
ncbi:ABC transporter permease subunit, partial [Kitasatospora nipponensis]|uniref:ABC transporter permease subunit n=1 Tax=Kitasatospora nipponensis TaxID=258049 RepID=UPI0031D7D9E0